MPINNLTARAAAWSARHRKRAIAGWLLFVIVAALAGGSLGTKIDQNEGSGESGRVGTFLRAHFPESWTENIIIQGRDGQAATGPAIRDAVARLASRVQQVPYVFDIRAPGRADDRGGISRDGRSALISLELGTRGNVDQLLALTAAAQRTHPRLVIQEFGDASANKAVNAALGSDFHRAEMLSLPLTLLILLLAFGSLVAAGLPVLLGLTAVGGTLGLVAVISQALPMDGAISSVVLLIGLAVGVDYSLFYLRREREERAAGASEEAALRAAAATSGHAVLVSGLTVMIAMAGMFLAGSRVFTSFAVGTILVVAVAVVGSLTVLPAVLSLLGSRVERGRIPLLHRLRRTSSGEAGIWGALLGAVTRRPGLAAALSGLALATLALPVLGMQTALPGNDQLPKSLPITQTYARIQAAFPGGPAPATVGIQAPDVRAPEIQAAVARLIAQAGRTPGLLHPVTLEQSADHRAETVSIPLAGSGTDARSDAALARLRSLVHHTFEPMRGVQAGVTGETAGTADFDAVMNSHLIYVFAFVLGMAFLLLLATFRSVLIATQAIVLNLLSVGAAYGLLVFVFQDGHLHGLLGFQGHGPITSWLPLFLFVVLFGLSMDYHVFILSRIRESYRRGGDPREAIVDGLRRSAGVVTSAALVMVGVFSVFGTLSMIEFKQMGVGLAAAILLDATIVRGVLLPATLSLLGERAWREPAWMRRRRPRGATRPPEPAGERQAAQRPCEQPHTLARVPSLSSATVADGS